MRVLMVLLLALLIIVGGLSYKTKQRLAAIKLKQETTKIADAEKNKFSNEVRAEASSPIVQVDTESISSEKNNETEREEARLESLRAKVEGVLKDSGSAQFRQLRMNAGASALCGEVNAKNSFGGFVGFRPFVSTDPLCQTTCRVHF